MNAPKRRLAKPLRKWYYDACTLDYSMGTYAEILNLKNHATEALVSHLSLGEAYANERLKGPEQAEAFIGLIDKLYGTIRVIQNDGIEPVLIKVLERFPRLSTTDAIHLATAINCKCHTLKTTDSDLLGLQKSEVRKFAAQFGCDEFNIAPVK